LNIALLFGNLNRGGAETLALQVIQNSKNSDLNFFCIHRKDGELLPDFVQTGVQVIKLYPKSPFDFRYLFKLRRLLFREKIQIVHTHQVADSFIAILSTLLTSVKTIQTFHGHGVKYGLGMRFMRRSAFMFNDKNIFVSNSQLDNYKQRFTFRKEKTSVLYNGIEVLKFMGPPVNNIRIEHKLEDDTLLSGTVGNFTDGRDQQTICRFLKLLSDSNIKFNHLFIGAKSKTQPWYFDQCVQFCKENQLEDCVHFLGSRKDVPDILPQLDVSIYSTEHDTFSLALIEAIISGIPVFANDWRAFLEITENGKLATLYQTKNENDLLEKFLDFLDHKEQFIEKAKKAATVAKNKYSIDAHVSELKLIYQSVLKS
jgi:glycosyltransferase involved in cell wall biosynthesis